MAYTAVIKARNEILPDELILKDVAIILQKSSHNEKVYIELGEGETNKILIQANTKIDIVTKAFLQEYYDINFRTGDRVQVAIGGVAEQKQGILSAKFCFATLYYNESGELVTIDFHQDMRYSNPKSLSSKQCRGSAPVPTPIIRATTGGCPYKMFESHLGLL